MDYPASVFRFKAVPGYNKSKLYTPGLGLCDFIMRSRGNSRRLGDPPRPHETHVMPNTGSRSDSKISIQHSKALQQENNENSNSGKIWYLGGYRKTVGITIALKIVLWYQEKGHMMTLSYDKVHWLIYLDWEDFLFPKQ